MSSTDLRDKAIALANEAVTADNAQNYEVALAKYVQAIETFRIAIKYEKAPSVQATIQDKCLEYCARAEYLKKQVNKVAGEPKLMSAGGGKGASADDDADDDDGGFEERPPLTEQELNDAEREMNEDLSKLVGMESVKLQMRKLCKQLALDIVRRTDGQTVLAPIRHCLMTGNPGTGKTSIARLVARLYKRLGVSSKDHVVEVQKGDLVAGYVNQTGPKTAKKIREARGGILFVDEVRPPAGVAFCRPTRCRCARPLSIAHPRLIRTRSSRACVARVRAQAYQLTQMLQRGQSDFSGESIDEMMRVMNESGPRSVTFIFAGYRKEMEQFMSYNPVRATRAQAHTCKRAHAHADGARTSFRHASGVRSLAERLDCARAPPASPRAPLRVRRASSRASSIASTLTTTRCPSSCRSCSSSSRAPAGSSRRKRCTRATRRSREARPRRSARATTAGSSTTSSSGHPTSSTRGSPSARAATSS
jgi:hypothetical protein